MSTMNIVYFVKYEKIRLFFILLSYLPTLAHIHLKHSITQLWFKMSLFKCM